MIIFGTRSKGLAPVTTNQSCTYCHNKNTISEIAVVTYFHIFWIPVFPVGKKRMTHCSHCKQVLSQRELAAEGRRMETVAPKTPLKYYAGLIIVGCFIVFVAAINILNPTGNLLKRPRVGDIYQVKNIDKKDLYTLWKVVGVNGEQVTLSTHDLNNIPQSEIDKKTLWEKYEAGFTSSTIELTTTNLQHMTEGNHNLVKVFRK